MDHREEELERERGEYEMRRLTRDVVSVPAWGTVGATVGFLLGGPIGALIGGAVGAISSGAESIDDKLERDSEWDGES